VKKREAQKALAAYMALHPHNVEQKVRVIVDHFRWNIRQRLGGKAKAMVVTRSRLHAVRYKRAFDAYLKESKLDDIGAPSWRSRVRSSTPRRAPPRPSRA
jgi:type I restriction enzyme, R subunit